MRLGLVQERADPEAIAAGAGRAVRDGAQIVCLQELTLSRYLDGMEPEDAGDGPTFRFAAALAVEHGVHVVASLFERPRFNTAIVVAPDGTLVSRTRKQRIPSSDGYGEDAVFDPGPADFPVADVGVRLATPTCYDQWFPEVARGFAEAGAEVIVYPSAIGTEPSRPDLDTQPMWEHAIVAHGIANATFMAAVNRVGTEGKMTFYGSSFVSDPLGRVIVRAPRDEPAVVVAELDLALRDEWRRLFPFDRARRS